MKRYVFLTKDDTYEALIRLRNAFLAAKDGEEVGEIINGLLSEDEKIKIGRRIIIAEYLQENIGIEVISKELKVGKNTIASVTKSLDKFPTCFKLLANRYRKVEKVYHQKSHSLIGASKKVRKQRVYTGFTRRQVKR